MNVVLIDQGSAVVPTARLSIRVRWPDMKLHVADTAAKGLELVEQISPDVVLFHPNFTDMSLSKAITELRRFSNIPLLVLSFEINPTEATTSLERGADDYIRLPCNLSEIIVRILAKLRRANGFEQNATSRISLGSGNLWVNPLTYEASLDGKPLKLTTMEFRLLYFLVRNRSITIPGKVIGQALWGNANFSPKVHVRHLRLKLGDDLRNPRWIATKYGVGYRFIGPAPDQTTEQIMV